MCALWDCAGGYTDVGSQSSQCWGKEIRIWSWGAGSKEEPCDVKLKIGIEDVMCGIIIFNRYRYV